MALSKPLVNGSIWGQVEGDCADTTGRAVEGVADFAVVFGVVLDGDVEEQPAANKSKARVAAPWR
ncbi:MAG: hypothetical protein LDL41_22070 [Coleofasciculus sp. S288]|nr:hypothetical protein [Coleofasciculus sp. S288]